MTEREEWEPDKSTTWRGRSASPPGAEEDTRPSQTRRQNLVNLQNKDKDCLELRQAVERGHPIPSCAKQHTFRLSADDVFRKGQYESTWRGTKPNSFTTVTTETRRSGRPCQPPRSGQAGPSKICSEVFSSEKCTKYVPTTSAADQSINKRTEFENCRRHWGTYLSHSVRDILQRWTFWVHFPRPGRGGETSW